MSAITPKEIELVKSSWELAKKDLRGAGVELFMIFFENHPEYQNFFPFRDIPLSQLRDHKRLHAHALNVMYTMSALIDNLDTDLLPALLEKNAKTHKPRKIPPEAFDHLCEAVLKLFKKAFPNEFTEEAEQAWKHVLEVAFKVIKEKLKSA